MEILMQDNAVQIRRARRTDFTAVMRLLADSGQPMPAADRATLRRFRHLVQDLGCDFYLGFLDTRLVGLVHVTYARQLAGAPRAEIAQFLVVGGGETAGLSSALIAFATARARKRGCAAVVWPPRHLSAAQAEASPPQGFASWGRCYIQNLTPQPADPPR